MYPELFRIPFLDRPIPSFGVMMMLGLLGVIFLSKALARRTGVNPQHFENLAILAVLVGIVGSRLSHVLENIGEYTDAKDGFVTNVFQAINITSGGLTFYGGFILATVVCIVYAKRVKLPIRHSMDIAAPCVMIGLAFGRIGCLLNGCCYGAECHLPWAITFPYGSYAQVDQREAHDKPVPPELIVVAERRLPSGEIETFQRPATLVEAQKDPKLAPVAAGHRSDPVHPAQIYSAFTAFLLAGLLIAYFTLPHNAGNVFMLMLILEGASRFVLELLRAEPAVAFGMSFSMIISLVLVTIGLVGWQAFDMFPQPRGDGALPLSSKPATA
jgi:phosphatidylglycerol---prolipoprotein diacylglyceryl transferase